MNRTILIAPDGQYYTNGDTYGTEIHLAVGLDGSGYYLIDESEVEGFGESTEEDYLNALERLGVARE